MTFGRKLKKVRSPDIVDILAKFNVAQSIAEYISGSISKASELIVEFTNEGLMVFKEEKVNIQAEENYAETNFILIGECSCKKQVNTGLPCSHYIRYLIETHQDIYSNISIAPRWTINKPQSFQFPTIIRNKVTYETPDVIPIDNKERFNILRARAIAFVQFAS
ncbi:hypothetical protein M9Y10_033438 [Tritrichomonas musculus]|uniref:SWIM-type domain-containing protein n=1 Tax=Tritrichomonas musculus TaxID=1915356 RepID=A0ABR2KC65_9EUKA